MYSSAPATTQPPGDAEVSTTTSSVNNWRRALQSLVSRTRKYWALSCLIASMSAMGSAIASSSQQAVEPFVGVLRPAPGQLAGKGAERVGKVRCDEQLEVTSGRGPA